MIQSMLPPPTGAATANMTVNPVKVLAMTSQPVTQFGATLTRKLVLLKAPAGTVTVPRPAPTAVLPEASVVVAVPDCATQSKVPPPTGQGTEKLTTKPPAVLVMTS